ncbi:MAG: cell division protein FtsK [Actinobacteria bacterium]|nr:cell division protein FtsK [Actinomycetota bacterium]
MDSDLTTTPDTDTTSGADTAADTGTTPDALDAPDTDTTSARSRRDVPSVVPGWLRDREAVTGLVRETLHRAFRLSVFHTVRVPLYWLRVAQWSPRGLARGTRAIYDWVTDTRSRAVLRSLAGLSSIGAQEGTAYRNVQEAWRERVRLRLSVTAVAALVLSAAVAVGVMSATTQVRALVALVLVSVLGWAGRPADAAPVVSSAGNAAGTPRLDTALIASALDALGIAALTRGLKEEGLTAVSPIHRDGPGWRVDLDLPRGVPAGDVIERRDRLAAGLRRPLACVWPDADPDAHEARLRLWVGDRPLSKAKPKPWPLAQRGTVDLFAPFPIGTDPRGRAVTLTLMFASMLVGAVPRMGKTFTLRLFLLAAALDVRAELHVYDLKGGADLRPLGTVAHRFRIGDDTEDLAYLAADIADVKADMARRYKTIRSLPEKICPEGKVTPDLAKQKRFGLHPVVVAIDECQIGFEDPEYGKQIEADITDLVKRGPAVGIIVLLATQRPDAKSIPTGISANAVLRFCLKVMGHTANDLVLGTGAYKAGIRATMFARSDRGTGYLIGEGDEPAIVQTSYVDATTAKTVAARARAARLVAGTLTGYAAALDATPDVDDVPTLLDDLAAVMNASEPKVWSEDLIARLVDLRPATYAGWTPADLGNNAGAYGIRTVQIGRRDSAGRVINRRGLTLPDILAAQTQRGADTSQQTGGDASGSTESDQDKAA